ncbi:hypothetical protein ABFT23_03000 [Nocardioides sp. C4-1]|uniref:hypothetical protein n=1 Tax=Nocardioides sp. C4-1 TaxID=3151851 RepID=UPI003263D365
MTRSRMSRLAALAAPAVLLASLTACGGDDGSDAPDGASKEDFCEAYQAEPALDDIDPDASPREQAEAIVGAVQEATDRLAEVGTPDDIPDDAREGFETIIDVANDLDVDEAEQAIEEQDSEYFDNLVTGDDRDKSDAFDEWGDDYCGDAEAPTDGESTE